MQEPDTNSKRKFIEIQESIENGLKRHRRHSSRDLMPPPTSDDSLGRLGIVSKNDQYACSQEIEENLGSFQMSNDHLRSKDSDSHELFRSISSPYPADIRRNFSHPVKDSKSLDAPVTSKTNYISPIEQYRFRTDRHPTKTKRAYPACHKKQFEPYGAIPLDSRSLNFRARRTSDEDGMDSTGTSGPFKEMAYDGNGRLRNERIISSAAKTLYPYSAYEKASPASISGVYVERQLSENQRLPQNREPSRKSVTGFDQAQLVSKIYQEPRYKRRFSVTSPFFERNSRFSQTPNLGRARHSPKECKFPSFINRSHLQGHQHDHEKLDAQLSDDIRGPIYQFAETKRSGTYSDQEIDMGKERHNTNILSRSKSDLLFLNPRSLSNAPDPTRATAAPLKTPITVTSASPSCINTRSVSSPVRPFMAFPRNSFAKRQYPSLQPNVSRSPLKHRLPIRESWPNTPYFSRRSLRR